MPRLGTLKHDRSKMAKAHARSFKTGQYSKQLNVRVRVIRTNTGRMHANGRPSFVARSCILTKASNGPFVISKHCGAGESTRSPSQAVKLSLRKLANTIKG